MLAKREENYDWLRVISMIAVIVIHVSCCWTNKFTERAFASGGGARVK